MIWSVIADVLAVKAQVLKKKSFSRTYDFTKGSINVLILTMVSL